MPVPAIIHYIFSFFHLQNLNIPPFQAGNFILTPGGNGSPYQEGEFRILAVQEQTNRISWIFSQYESELFPLLSLSFLPSFY
jgi:hypothetical protein